MSIIRGCTYDRTDLLNDIQSNLLKENLDFNLSASKDSDQTKQQLD